MEHFVRSIKYSCKIWTDYKNLEYFITVKQLNKWQVHWSLYFAWFNSILCHRPGKSMDKPNTLSCRADYRTGADNNSNVVFLSPPLFMVYMLEGLELVGLEQDILWDICKGVKHLEEKIITKTVQKLYKLFTFLLLDGLNVIANCTTTVRSTFLMHLSSAIILSLFAMTPRYVAGHLGYFKF